MTKRSIRIQLKNGLEARPVALLVQEASKYDSTIYIWSGERRVNAKSIMGMMSLGLDNGEELVVSADGMDEEVAVVGIENFLSGRGERLSVVK
jgi:catabolite repression HPr-like protein